VLIIALFLVWIAFFDQDSLLRQIGFSRDLNEARQLEEYYLTEYKNDSTLLHQLENDPAVMEKLAREKYLMKKPDEKIFVVVEKE